MRVAFVTPVAAGSSTGNAVTARRWAGLVASLGHEVELGSEWSREACDVLVALHARKSQAAAAAYRAARPDGRLFVALTGTDLNRDLPDCEVARAALRMADRIITLYPGAEGRLPVAERAKVVAILQSSEPIADQVEPVADAFEVVVLAHLRAEKDPLRAAAAARLLPAESRLRVLHAGIALDPEMAVAARLEQAENLRYRWCGGLAPDAARRLLAASRALVITSLTEGGANVISEAVVQAVPVLASRIESSVALLGTDYPGFFRVGDTADLAALLARTEADAGFRAELVKRGEALRPGFLPAQERAAWAALLSPTGPDSAGGPGCR